mmetsp:Transcript_27118/g.90742  ORF Transcript_27118/g.90742 Transcript_27118/m.90742 type:complete len:239 (+) Transcript_27118:244-960(+)
MLNAAPRRMYAASRSPADPAPRLVLRLLGTTLAEAPDSSLDLQHARSYQLLDLALDVRVLEELVGRRRVVLHLPKHLADRLVVEDGLDLRVGHRALRALLLVLALRARLDGGERALHAVLGLGGLAVQLEGLVVSIQGLVVLLEVEVEPSFSSPGLDERGAHLDALVAVLERHGPLHELLVAGGAVGVGHVVLWVAPHGLRVGLYGFRVLALLEQGVPLLARGLGLVGVLVGELLALL